MSSLFSWHDPAVKKLLGWRQGSEEEKWAEKAVDSLVKKLKKNKNNGHGSVEELEFALANPGLRSKCVTIPKSLDGRLQVSHKKGLPHVIYCRVWRWPDLQSHQELRPVPECVHPYDQKGGLICINPYHYQRIENPHKPFIQQPYYESSSSSMHSASSVYSGASSSSPPLPMQIPSPASSSFSNSSPTSSSYVTAVSPSSALSEDDAEPMAMRTEEFFPQPRRIPQVNFPNYWATVGYYELNTRVGELFKLTSKSLTIDGFTDPSNSDSRICLGLISNVNRNTTIENTRKHIGKGLRLECAEDAFNVVISNLSEASLFVQSRNVNIKMSQPPTTVCRIPPNHSFCIFDNVIFHHLLQKASREGQVALYDLQKMCFIRLSFVKGWGPDFPRHDITSTPCWIEIQLHQPLAWIDQNLSMDECVDPQAGSSLS